MLYLYQSNRLATLATLLSEGILAHSPADPYARETVIVQARGMGRWLSLKIAGRFGVCANVDFPLPATWLWRLIEAVLGPQSQQGSGGINPFSSDALAWRLHGLLMNPPPALADYLQDGSERKRWRLASRLADVFDQYLVYRPDWLASWEAGQLCGLGGDEVWQMQLWQALAKDRNNRHRADLMQQLIARLQDPAPLPLPERIVLFGISSLPPLLLQVLQALAQRIDVALFALNPCAAPWGDVSRDSDSRAIGERLLAAWGGQGRVFFDELAGADELHSLFDEAPAGDHLLAQLQHDILTLQAPTPRILQASDHSLAIHACHGPLRQVETLKDALVACFAADSQLQPDEVVVLCPDIETFAPYIEAVFGQGEPVIPYAVADRGSLAQSPLLAGFLTLLALPDSNWEADRLAALLEIPALAARFDLLEADLPRLRDWIADAGIRRGQAGDAFSWQAGIGRLLLGTAMADAPGDPDQLPLFAGLKPSSGLDLRFASDAAGLARFARQLGQWQTALAQPRSLADWATALIAWLPRWFAELAEDGSALDTLHKALATLAELERHGGVAQKVGRSALLEWLKGQLEAGSGAGGFLTGGVTFAQLMPMRNLPFKVVAVLGLDDGAFPREAPPDGFDLIARHPRRGDRARALDERWLFLETLLAARDSLLLFYTGRDVRSDAELPPSTVIADLLDAVAQDWHTEDGQPPASQIVQHHPLQPFSPARFAGPAASFDSRWAQIAGQLGRTGSSTPLVAGRLPGEANDQIELVDLLALARDPAGWFLRRIGVRFERSEAMLANREVFSLSRHEQTALLALAGDRADMPATLAALGHGAALLPEGPAGAIWAARQAAAFAPAVRAWRGLADSTLPVDLHIGHYRLSGLLQGIAHDGLGLRQPGKLREGDRLLAWLQHLVLCTARPADVASQTRLIGLEAMARYQPVADASEKLGEWLDLYRHACQTPPVLLPRSSFAYAKGLLGKNGPDPGKALAAAQAAWQGNDQVTGEGAFDSVRALWRDATPFEPDYVDSFVALAEQLLVPLLQHEQQEDLA